MPQFIMTNSMAFYNTCGPATSPPASWLMHPPSRVFTSMVAGTVTGILGLTGPLGFAAYLAAQAAARASRPAPRAAP